MKRFFTILLFMSFNNMFSQEVELINKFGSYLHKMDSTTIPYRMFIPEKAKNEKLPLIIALHGAGERGNDNQKHIELHRIATVWVDSVNQNEHPCFVVAPQCPEEQKWVDVNWGTETYDFKNTPISNELATVSNLIDSLILKYPIDESRIYITGLSMGGFGSWYLLMNNPTRFAAAIIMSGSADPQMACEIKNIPIWDFHGDIDAAVPVEGSRKMIRAISNCGKDVLLISDPNNKAFLDSENEVKRIMSSDHIYTEYKDKGHVIWKESYDNWLVREWLFSKQLIRK
ncbi:MAG: prolyl oligopeptidase family serine peptidase [Bacteroidetes bacterium]|nr:prolyl oligopeptidase family serine peptidase [Bacteroidota bacterium]MBU1116665.1 prolyl oligopeptidase family serine peptidase [Bacteroidota bacterium]MBU1797484.1 prolyl oligopeptidase family serine peptidase [Bacteroidota bacterium]